MPSMFLYVRILVKDLGFLSLPSNPPLFLLLQYFVCNRIVRTKIVYTAPFYKITYVLVLVLVLRWDWVIG